MAAVQGRRTRKTPEVKSILTGTTSSGSVNDALLVDHEDAIISVSGDKTLRVWAKRSTGQYWPTICHVMSAACTALDYHNESRKIFIGLSNGQIHGFELSEDVNRITPKQTYNAHSKGVTCVKYVPDHSWILSTGRDKRFSFHCTRTGKVLGSYEVSAWCMKVEFDMEAKFAFIGDYSGVVHVLTLKPDGLTHMTTLRGHQNSIRAMTWDQGRRLLFTGGYDEIVVIWDIGSKQGDAFELTGQKSIIVSLGYFSETRQLLSAGEDGSIGVWDVAVDRKESVEWQDSNICSKCQTPFFWNIKGMWHMKKIGRRQHHCRKCGRALCDSCSAELSTYPKMGFEVEVRMCKECNDSISTDDRSPMASFTKLHPPIRHMHVNEKKGLLVTVHSDESIRLWDVTEMVS